MQASLFNSFRLVGGTALSLYLGHRMSVDIDLFTDQPYDSVDFNAIDEFLQATFPYVRGDFGMLPGLGKSYLVGDSEQDHIKLDVYYTNDPFIQPAMQIDKVRMATVDEITAMKIDVISRGGRKKDFWDIHELLDKYTLEQMLALHRQRHEYTHNEEQILHSLVDFTRADEDFDPFCLRGKYWEFIKDDIMSIIQSQRQNL
ncbi:nucleotidyl transferase AbiEii/AbiGii toxin family protein [Pedobacter sp. BS3]|uniref:nucleotidyl transferase AbiEii/AbiGii toxin family protein n=1 Tax=Pedobacter sp. BS3 TaxID=2567937 RepID=UPI001F5B7A9B|nr:nucleotidyl transferase AbiEii/AbiGii toxin family protein [Pedobacter sp. BS3]